MNKHLGQGFSEGDRRFEEMLMPNIANTPEGNLAIIDILKKTNNRNIEIGRMARSYAAKHGGRFDSGFYDELATWSEAHPLFTEEYQKAIPKEAFATTKEGSAVSTPNVGTSTAPTSTTIKPYVPGAEINEGDTVMVNGHPVKLIKKGQ
jgi:hypothetical protein